MKYIRVPVQDKDENESGGGRSVNAGDNWRTQNATYANLSHKQRRRRWCVFTLAVLVSLIILTGLAQAIHTAQTTSLFDAKDDNFDAESPDNTVLDRSMSPKNVSTGLKGDDEDDDGDIGDEEQQPVEESENNTNTVPGTNAEQARGEETHPKSLGGNSSNGPGSIFKATSRLLSRGVPLVDTWLPSRYTIPGEKLQELYDTVGFPSRNIACTRDNSVNPRKSNIVVSSFQLKGFGSNILDLTNDMIFARQHNKHYMLMSRRYQNRTDHKFAKVVGYSNEFEKHFAFSVEGDTVCTSYAEVCIQLRSQRKKGKAFDVCAGPTQHLYANPGLAIQLRQDLTFFLSARVELTRILTRLNPRTREKVDANIVNVPMMDENEKPGLYCSITIHVRRGDKYLEAPVTPSLHYVKVAFAVIKQLKANSPSMPQLLSVVVVTDDPVAGKEVISLFKQTALSSHDNTTVPTKGFFLRDSAFQSRPDVTTDGTQDSGIISMLGDLKLMVMATIFIGTQSSNFGLLACYLRGTNDCYNAENKVEPFAWDNTQDRWA